MSMADFKNMHVFTRVVLLDLVAEGKLTTFEQAKRILSVVGELVQEGHTAEEAEAVAREML